MQEHISYQQVKAIKKSVIVSDLTLIVFTAITFCASLFVNIKHFFIFAISCFLVKFLTNFWVEKKYRFPSAIHLFAPIPFAFLFYIGYIQYIFVSAVNDFQMSYIIFLLLMFLVFVFVVFYFYIKKIFKFQINYIKNNFKWQIFPSVSLFNYYNFIGNFTNKVVCLCLFVFQFACFLSIILSIFLGVMVNFFENIHPIQGYVFTSLFSPLLWFALFNLMEVCVFLFIKFPKDGKYFEQTKWKMNIIKLIVAMFFSIIMAFFISLTPYVAEPFVKSHLGYQYETTMEKLIKLKKY